MSPGWIRRLWPYLMAHRTDVVVSFGAAFAGLAVSAFTPVVEKVQRWAAGVKGFFVDVWDKVGAPVWDFLKSVGGAIWETIRDIAAWIWDRTKPIRDWLAAGASVKVGAGTVGELPPQPRLIPRSAARPP